jgi:hypothetical protein
MITRTAIFEGRISLPVYRAAAAGRYEPVTQDTLA